MSGVITVYKTDVGATRQAYSLLNGKSMTFIGFALGNGGHNTTNGNPKTVDRSDTSLKGKLFGISDNFEQSIVNGTTIQLKCKLRSGEASGTEISNLGIYAQVSGETDNFLYAISNFAVITRGTATMTFTIKFSN